jgi:glucokinase
MHVLAGDIGGTNTRLIFAEMAENSRRIITEKSYPSAEFAGLIPVIDVFLQEHGLDFAIDAACFAIAGPVEFGSAKVTNLPWVIKQQELCRRLQTLRVTLINDLAAAAYGVAQLETADLVLLQQGSEKDNGPVNPDAVVVAAGTGLGAAHRVWLKDHYQVLSTESGHAGFASENAEQTELLAWMQKTHSHVSLEMLLSGRGLLTIYHFLRDVKGLTESSIVRDDMHQIDPAQVISEHGLAGDDVLCQKTLEIFVDIYGAAAGDIVLQHYPVSELYIAGGIAPKIKDKILEPRFINAFVNKNLMASNMKKVTVKLVMQEKAGLFGALSVAQSSLVHSN